ncbi:hypothetical protein D3C86_1765580 [compost metagenome]
MQAGLEFAVGGFEFLAVALVFLQQVGTVKRPAHRVLKHREVFQRLDQVVGCAQAQGLDRIVHDTCAGDDDDGKVGRALGHLANQLQATHLRHTQVANHEVGPLALEYFETLQAIGRLQNAEATVFKVGRKACAHYIVIIDYQQRGTGFVHVGKRRQK